MLNLPILPKQTSLVDKNGYATFSFQRYWQNFKSAITSQEESQEQVIADLQTVQEQQTELIIGLTQIQEQQAAQIADIQAALDAANQAQSTADTALQTAAAAQAKAEQVETEINEEISGINQRITEIEQGEEALP